MTLIKIDPKNISKKNKNQFEGIIFNQIIVNKTKK
ncbi:MAG: hypothetical protein KatS3mg092_0109 [Patescibacteria group bacterium]|nr:MAG: hypothetical protein KatS3mg092_0109 [Patescibacteria group bacterium]